MIKKIEIKLIEEYSDFYNTPALHMFDEDDDKLDDLHSEIELLGAYVAGFIENYLKTKNIGWRGIDLQKKVKFLNLKIKKINIKSIKEKKLFLQYKKYAKQIINLIDLMLFLSKKPNKKV